MSTLFAPIPTLGSLLTMPNGVTVPILDADPVPSTGETILTLGLERGEDGRPLGALYGVVSVDELGTITGTLDGVLVCPYATGDTL